MALTDESTLSERAYNWIIDHAHKMLHNNASYAAQRGVNTMINGQWRTRL